MRTWTPGRRSKVLLLGAIGLVLQQIGVPYTVSLFGVSAEASLLHLHMGLLLAIAMLDRDRAVLAGTTALIFVGWCLRAWSSGYDLYLWLPIGALAYVLTALWAGLCAHWMGWPKPPGRMRVDKVDLARFAGFGLLLFPLGTTLISLVVTLPLEEADRLSVAVQTLFARYCGVSVFTLPAVVAWSERAAPLPRALGWRAWLVPLLLCLGVAASIVASERVHDAFSSIGGNRPVLLMDYRFALFALLGWCVLRLRPRHAMPLLALTQFTLVQGMAGAAERNGTPPGFVNLVHLGFELGVLQIALLSLLVYERDARESATRLEAEARRDTATGLPNLAAWRDRVEALGGAPAQGEVGFLLLDHTDDLVAGFGLDMQSRVMNTVATALALHSQPYLLGMGQFALWPGEREVDAAHWEGVIDAVALIEVDSGDHRFGLSPYLGVARFQERTPEAIEAALLRASQLAFEARRRNEVRPLLDDAASLESGAMRRQLHAANEALACLRGGRVELHLQAIRPLDPAHPASAEPECAFGEVLCRLRSPQGRLMLPDEFLAPIEAVGRCVELDLCVLRSLFATLHQYPQVLPRLRRIGVNLTVQSLASQSFKRQFEELLADSPLPLSALCFEITENAVISSEAHTRNLLDDLRQRGCRIAIDDFGKGMQSFARLKEVPVDIIKIDGAFVRHVAERGRDFALVEASVAIARAFEAETVAEYVETEATADCLRRLGVQWMQGYLHARPQPLEQLLADAR
jgi:EAL domain-containing protein (putative c-di-GMP-specific phosphodiesterase class I)/GGDEF domain-containing protein